MTTKEVVVIGAAVFMLFTVFGVGAAFMQGDRAPMPWWLGLALGAVVAVTSTYTIFVARLFTWWMNR